MKCAVHTDVDAVAYCRNCGKPLCSACARPIRDVIYCEDCLAATLGLPGPVPPSTEVSASGAGAAPQNPYAAPAYSASPTPVVPGAPIAAPRHISNPTIALILGFFPGLGAVYNGEYNKALIHIVIFAAMIVGLSSDLGDGATTALAMLLAGFVFYMAIDAMRSAKARNQGLATADPLENWSKDRPVGPIILIGLGALFLLNNFSWFPFYRMQRLWPLILIAAGALMFRNRIGRSL
jgi:cell wall-active antibiotic response 4TMS protein YvqF/B-box zinc finger protein